MASSLASPSTTASTPSHRAAALPPRPHSARAARLTSSPSPSAVYASPRAAKVSLALKTNASSPSPRPQTFAPSSVPVPSPRRPMSASRVQPTAASLAQALSSPTSLQTGYSRVRPASASRARVAPPSQYQPLVAVETIAFPTKRMELNAREYESPSASRAHPSAASGSLTSPPQSPRPESTIASLCSAIRQEQLAPPAPIDPVERAKLRAFLESWEDSASAFRSAILFSETTFAQAKAMVAEWPTPNAFLAAIAYGCLEQFGRFVEAEYPFLRDVITELGVAVYANFPDLLDLQRDQALEPRNRFLFYFQHGQHWFQELAEQRRRVESLQFTAATSKDEIQRLNDKLQQRQQDDYARVSNGAAAAASAAAPVVTTPTTPLSYDAQRAAATASSSSVASAQLPQLRNLLYYDTSHRAGSSRSAAVGTVRLDLDSATDFDFWPCCEELVLVFQSLAPKDAVKVLGALMERAAALELPGLGETFAVGVDVLSEHERREFLREYFLLVSPSELQDALQQRDECNDEKRWQLFVDELKDRLGIVDRDSDGSGDDDDLKDARHWSSKDAAERSSPQSALPSTARSVRGTTPNTNKSPHHKHHDASAPKRLAHFHSSEAKVGAKVLEMVELLEDLAVEASFLEPHQSGLSSALLKRLRAYEDPSKRVAKARELMMHASAKRAQQAPVETERTPCACHCGNHQLLRNDELAAMLEASAPRAAADDDDVDDADKSAKRKSSRRSSALKRPLSAKRKNAVSFGNRLASSRGSTTQLRLFPLSEVCHMLSAILHLQFSREATELAMTPASSRTGATSSRDRGSVVALSALMEDRWSFVRRTSKPPSFKTLAKDFLTRKYGIKSIAVMHTLQLERSLVYYSSMDKHVRCELFAWFFGADKLRVASKDYAFQFFQALVKTVVGLFASKRPASAATAALPSASVYPQHHQLPALSFATLLSIWTEYIGDGDTSSSSGALVRFLTPSHAIDACQCAFPVRMRETSEFSSFLEKLYRVGLERDQVELEPFLKRAMELWLSVFDRFVAEVAATLDDGAADFDFDAFSHVVTVRNGMELTGGERLELFDLLSHDSDATVVTRTKLLNFVLEAKYLRATR